TRDCLRGDIFDRRGHGCLVGLTIGDSRGIRDRHAGAIERGEIGYGELRLGQGRTPEAYPGGPEPHHNGEKERKLHIRSQSHDCCIGSLAASADCTYISQYVTSQVGRLLARLLHVHHRCPPTPRKPLARSMMVVGSGTAVDAVSRRTCVM